MSKVDLNELSDMQYDLLREIGNIGAGNATTALAQLLDMRMDMSVPSVALLPFKEVAAVMGSEEMLVVGILLELSGDINGTMMFLINTQGAHELINKLMHQDNNITAETFDEMELSALKEIGNIVSGSYLTALATLTNMKIVYSVPKMTIDMAGAILSVPAIEFGKYGDKMLMIQNRFGDSDIMTGYFLLIPELESYDKILSSLGM